MYLYIRDGAGTFWNSEVWTDSVRERLFNLYGGGHKINLLDAL